MTTPTLRHALLALALVLAACGAPGPGGDANRPPGAPTLTLTPTAIKTFHFTWPATERASEYRLLEDPTGSSELEPIATLPANTTSYTHEVSLPARINARYQLHACNQHGCTASDIVPVTGTLSEAVGYVKASNAGARDRFGVGVALSADGTTLAVGADGESGSATGVDGDEDAGGATNAGAVYVFVRTGPGTWEQQAYVKASNTDPGDQFGHSVALSADGSTLAVGAIGEASASTGINGRQNNNTAAGAGAVYVFTRDQGTWSQQAYVKASNTSAGDSFGWSLALSDDGDTLAVGAINESSNASGIDDLKGAGEAPNSGAVYVFGRRSGAWAQLAYVKASNTAPGDRFGWSVSLSGDGDTLAVGAPLERGGASGVDGDQADASRTAAGAVYVFTRAQGAWRQHAYVKASTAQDFQFFGASVALAGNGSTLAVGATGDGSAATGIDGDEANDDAEEAGAVYLFARNDETWAQQAYVKASNTASSQRFGESVSLSADGRTLAVGAIGERSAASGINGDQTADDDTSDAGAVYVFTRSQATWAQQAYVKASNTQPSAEFGWRVALSGDGATLAVGALYENGGARGVGGDQRDDTAEDAGAVYLY